MKVVFIQRVATGGSVLDFNLRNQEPGYGTLLDKSGVGGGVTGLHLAPDDARAPGVLSCGANRARGHHRWISIALKRVGAEVVGSDFFKFVVKQPPSQGEQSDDKKPPIAG